MLGRKKQNNLCPFFSLSHCSFLHSTVLDLFANTKVQLHFLTHFFSSLLFFFFFQHRKCLCSCCIGSLSAKRGGTWNMQFRHQTPAPPSPAPPPKTKKQGTKDECWGRAGSPANQWLMRQAREDIQIFQVRTFYDTPRHPAIPRPHPFPPFPMYALRAFSVPRPAPPPSPLVSLLLLL